MSEDSIVIRDIIYLLGRLTTHQLHRVWWYVRRLWIEEE